MPKQAEARTWWAFIFICRKTNWWSTGHWTRDTIYAGWVDMTSNRRKHIYPLLVVYLTWASSITVGKNLINLSNSVPKDDLNHLRSPFPYRTTPTFRIFFSLLFSCEYEWRHADRQAGSHNPHVIATLWCGLYYFVISELTHNFLLLFSAEWIPEIALW